MSNNKKYKILFVCLGNICRSSAAEEIFRNKISEEGFSNIISVDSAGLINFHQGEKSDPRMIAHAQKRGYNLTHRSRPITQQDYHNFDLIIGMDSQNIYRLKKDALKNNVEKKIHIMTEFLTEYNSVSIPDPYYGGASDFEYVLDLLEDASNGLIQYIKKILSTI